MMLWVMIPMHVVVGSLVPAFVLWLVGKKLQYDFYFWKVVVVTTAASLVGLIPFAGFWLQPLVYYGLFLKLTGIGLIEALWASIIAFLIKVAVFFIVIFSVAYLFNTNSDDMKAYTPSPAIEREQGGLTMMSADGSPLSKQFVKRFDISGTGKGVNGRFAIINGEIFHEGYEFEDGARVDEVIRNEVVIFFNEEYYHLVLQ